MEQSVSAGRRGEEVSRFGLSTEAEISPLMGFVARPGVRVNMVHRDEQAEG